MTKHLIPARHRDWLIKNYSSKSDDWLATELTIKVRTDAKLQALHMRKEAVCEGKEKTFNMLMESVVLEQNAPTFLSKDIATFAIEHKLVKSSDSTSSSVDSGYFQNTVPILKYPSITEYLSVLTPGYVEILTIAEEPILKLFLKIVKGWNNSIGLEKGLFITAKRLSYPNKMMIAVSIIC